MFVRVSLYISVHLHFQKLTTLKILTILMIGYICFTASTLLLPVVWCTRYRLSSSVHQADFFGMRVRFIESDKDFVGYS